MTGASFHQLEQEQESKGFQRVISPGKQVALVELSDVFVWQMGFKGTCSMVFLFLKKECLGRLPNVS